ncbi:hypothetical protein BCR33DRAFT_714064 [Rhizoclosmatium globosum]|uniref:RING-type domain-containing protein n=1 Tax=Rhizoclosmatium globosum TaxID=329046 RepID=A0A1Y2CQ68_9FUNG|nr:hypothetical protein BCR33DRAFT_714064 [Rhizoclosmatium globosum]|eukprot:ORY48974.1 hypothetical protein BCR33DRAFT_714064 [Rhizoclosmatium globosum]
MNTNQPDLENLLESARQRVARLMEEARELEDRLDIVNPVAVQRPSVPSQSRNNVSQDRTRRERSSKRSSEYSSFAELAGSTLSTPSSQPHLSSSRIPTERHARNLPSISGSRSKLIQKPQLERIPRISTLSSWNPNYDQGSPSSESRKSSSHTSKSSPRKSSTSKSSSPVHMECQANGISVAPTASLINPNAASSSTSSSTHAAIQSSQIRISQIQDYLTTTTPVYNPIKYESPNGDCQPYDSTPECTSPVPNNPPANVNNADLGFFQIHPIRASNTSPPNRPPSRTSMGSLTAAGRISNPPRNNVRYSLNEALSIGGSSLPHRPLPPSSAALRRRASENGVDALLERLRISSTEQQQSPTPLRNERQPVEEDEDITEDEIEDGELWYQTVFGNRDHTEELNAGDMSIDDETPVQRLLRRYNAGMSGFDSGMLRRFMGFTNDPNEIREMRDNMDQSNEDTAETLTQHLMRLSEQAMNESFDVDTDDDFADHGISLSLIESIMAISQNMNLPIQPLGTTDEEINKIPIQIISSTRNIESCCPICLADFTMGDSAMEFPGCAHNYHRTCLSEWLKVSRHCPTCRRELQLEDSL